MGQSRERLQHLLSSKASELAEYLTELIVRQGGHSQVIGAGHGFGGEERVDDRLLGGLHRRLVHWIDPVILEHAH